MQSGRGPAGKRARWKAPPHNLWLTALLLLVFPWDDTLIDLLEGSESFSAVLVYGIWIVFDCVLVLLVLLTGDQSTRTCLAYVLITLALDIVTAAYYSRVDPNTTAGLTLEAAIDVAVVALVARIVWKILGRRTAQNGVPLFRFAVPLIVSIAIAYAAAIAASVGCVPRCGSEGAKLDVAFFEQSSQIIAALLVALVIEARLLRGDRGEEEVALIQVTVVGFAAGVAASLAAVAMKQTHVFPSQLPLSVTFPLTVQALALGFVTILMLPRLSREPKAKQSDVVQHS